MLSEETYCSVENVAYVFVKAYQKKLQPKKKNRKECFKSVSGVPPKHISALTPFWVCIALLRSMK
jgi:hypothetical protein